MTELTTVEYPRMLRHRDKLDILERYCGDWAHKFAWAIPTGIRNELTYQVSTKVGNWIISVKLVKDQIQLVFHTAKVGGSSVLFKCTLANPKGTELCEKKIGLIMQAMEPELYE